MYKTLALAIAILLAFSVADDASAARKKRLKRTAAPEIMRDYDGTPIIMKGYRPPRTISIMKDEPGAGRTSDRPSKKADRPRAYPRGSSGYVAPVLPSSGGSSIPASALTTVPPASAPPPPPTSSFGDRVINCIHSYPLNAGIGNNPSGQQQYVRQCAN